jgi:hypothetical protein
MSKKSESQLRVEAGAQALMYAELEAQRADLDRKMGIASASAPEPHLEGTRLVCPAMTPAQAKARLDQLNARKAAR